MLQEVSKLADRSRTFKTHGTGPEGRHLPYTRRFRLPSKIHDAVPMFVDIEDCLGFAGVEPDLFCGCHQNVDASDVGSFPETGREDLLVHRRFQSLLGGVQAQFVRLPAPGDECGMSHPDFGLTREVCHGLSVGFPVRARPIDELLRHRADFERMANGSESLGQELAQLPVGQVRSWIDIIEVEDKEGRVVHSEKLLSVPTRINLVELVSPGEHPGLLDPDSR